MTVRQLRLVIETEDYEAALTFFRDVLGLPEEESYSEGDARVAILAVERATLELANPAQVRLIDRVETGRVGVSHPYPLSVRVAFEVDDTASVTDTLQAGGASVVAPPTRTPWNSLNARFEAPGGMQITAFEELG
jgi:lactoylglutathione lyase